MARVTVTKDIVNRVLGDISKLVSKEVLVGIASSSTTRQNEPGTPITNAALGYIHEFGAPAANIPARPFLIPGVRKTKGKWEPHLKAACEAALEADQRTADKELASAGILGASGAQNEIHTGNFVPLKPSTVANRNRSRQTQGKRTSELQYESLIKGGATPEAAQSAAGIRPLINTGQLARSITSVVRKRK